MALKSENTGKTLNYWRPLGLDVLLSAFGISSFKTWGAIFGWIVLIGLSIYSVLLMLPGSWVSATVDVTTIQTFFLFYPPLIIGVLLLFWVGFEWGFIPVFLSSFVIAFSASMPVQWALLFAFSFVLGLGIYALAYYCVPVRIDLRSIKSIAFFTVVSLIAAMASSLGSFVWSLEQGISPLMTVQIWNGWWTGAFFQSMIIIVPLLYLFSPTVVRLKNRLFDDPEPEIVTLGWIYSAIGSVVAVVSLFMIGGRILGIQGISLALSQDPVLAGRVLQASESFQIIFWISMGIILTVGLTGIYLVASWNLSLKEEVDEKTSSLKIREEELEASVNEKVLLLNEIHGRVKNNLSIVLALFELQLKRTGDETLSDTLRDSKSRIRSISLIHELISQSGSYRTLNLKAYVIKLTNRLEQDYRFKKKAAEINIHSEDLILDIERAVPVCMIINEIISRVYEKTFANPVNSVVSIDLYSDSQVFYVVVREKGSLPFYLFDWDNADDLGIKLIRSLTKQIKGEMITDNKMNSIAILFPNLFEPEPITLGMTGSNTKGKKSKKADIEM